MQAGVLDVLAGDFAVEERISAAVDPVGELVLQACNVSVMFSGASGNPVHALDRVSVGLPAAEFVVALGASGCGKTTLLRILAGFLKPTSGIATHRGRPIAGPSVERGVVFQNHSLFPWLDVRGNVEFALRVRGVDRAQRRLRAASVLSQVGLLGAERQPTWSLSGGMQQRVGLARALASDPQVLLMDEPLGALDAITRQAMQTLLLDIWAETGKSIFLITHDIEEAILLATRLVIMSPQPGRIVAERSLDFGRRYVAGERLRHIKSDPAFIEAREDALTWIVGGECDRTHSFAGGRRCLN
jgi:taurine transport system ATP-binding protein